jgi:predicted phosphodiesterase
MKGEKALNKAFMKAAENEIEFTNADKFIIFSDLHRGTNDWGDDFAHNQLIYFHALRSYYEQGFTYIENGDGDELGENWFFNRIRRAHSHVHWLMREFHRKGRLKWIYGNHDMVRRYPSVVNRALRKYYDKDNPDPANQLKIHEALVLRHKESNKQIFILHGHQADWFNNYLWWLGTLFLPFWKGFFQKALGLKDPTSPAKVRWRRNQVTENLKYWVGKTKQITIAGHTHQSELPQTAEARKNLPYFNDGSGIHPRCITGIEIVNGEIALVKWWLNTETIAGDLSRNMVLTRQLIRAENDDPIPRIPIGELGA